MRRPIILLATAILVGGYLFAAWPVGSSPTLMRYSISAGLDDAWQRGTPTVQYGQDNAAPYDYLGRSDDPSLRMNSGLRFHTDLQPGEHVTAAFLRGWNNFGQSFTGCIYGDLDGRDFSATNPTILSRPHTSRCVMWSQTSIPMRAGYSPDVSPIVNELAARAGFDGTVSFLILGAGGRDNQSIDWRSFENLTGPAPMLEVQT